MERLLSSVIQGQAIPRITARMLKSAPGEMHLHTPQQQLLCPICQTNLSGCYQLMC